MSRKLTHKQIARKGGLTILKKYGRSHFSKLGKKSGRLKKKRR